MDENELLEEKALWLANETLRLQKEYLEIVKGLPPSFDAFMNDGDYHELKVIDLLFREAYVRWLEYTIDRQKRYKISVEPQLLIELADGGRDGR